MTNPQTHFSWKRILLGFCSVATVIGSVYSTAYSQEFSQAAFSPSSDAIKLVTATIGGAHNSIELAAYTFTSQKVADALVAAKNRGVDVKVVLDKRQANRNYPALETVRAAGIAIRINSDYAIMHDKYIIVDNKTVETGSFNFTKNAELHNAENVIVIKDNIEVASEYLANWQKLWNEAK